MHLYFLIYIYIYKINFGISSCFNFFFWSAIPDMQLSGQIQFLIQRKVCIPALKWTAFGSIVNTLLNLLEQEEKKTQRDFSMLLLPLLGKTELACLLKLSRIVANNLLGSETSEDTEDIMHWAAFTAAWLSERRAQTWMSNSPSLFATLTHSWPEALNDFLVGIECVSRNGEQVVIVFHWSDQKTTTGNRRQ